MDNKLLAEIINGLREINKNLVEIKDNQNNFPINEFLDKNGSFLSTIDGLAIELQNLKR